MKSRKRKGLIFTLLQLTLTCALVRSLICPDDEYSLPDRCCRKCPSGTQVLEDCSPSVNTTRCLECAEKSFMNESTSRRQCYPCTSRTCGGPGLMVKTCSRSSDSLCEVQEGYFCEKSDGGSCVSAKKHSVCEPGQYIKQQGSASADTVCFRCPNSTFSNGTSASCQPHTLCERLDKVTEKPGTPSSDAVCVEATLYKLERNRSGLIYSLANVAVVLLLGIVRLYVRVTVAAPGKFHRGCNDQ